MKELMKGADTDESLMAAYIRGDRQAFVFLFDRYAPRIHSFFLQVFRDVPTADDLMQVTFLKVHRARDSYQQEMAFRPWLFTIASRVRLDEFRRRGRHKEELDEDKLMGIDAKSALKNFQDTARQEEIIRAVRAVLETLPEGYRAVLHLHRYEQMTFAEIAQVLGISESAAKVRAFRAYEKLREELSSLLHGE